MSDLIGLFDTLPVAVLIFSRIVALLVSAPVLGDETTPLRVKALLALSMTLIIVPVLIPNAAYGPASGVAYAVTMAREVAVGLTIGFLMNCFFMGVQFGADLMGRTAGFAAAEMFDPSSGGMQGPIGRLFHIVMVLLFLLSDGHLYLIGALVRSFEIVPIGSWAAGPALQVAVAGAMNQLFIIGITFAFPVLAVVLTVAAAEGVITRAIPQINILHITFAIKIMIFLCVMYAGAPAAVAFVGLVIETAQHYTWQAIPTFR